MPKIGVIKGATSMAPMTTAVLLDINPKLAIKVETARLITWKAAWLADQGQPNNYESSVAKCYATDISMEVTTDAVQVLGGYGYSKEYPVERYMRDAKLMQIYEGANQIQRIVISRNVLR